MIRARGRRSVNIAAKYTPASSSPHILLCRCAPTCVQKRMASQSFVPRPGKPAKSRSRYNTGRWMKEEHEAFLRGVEMYNKDWHLIATAVKTRSVLQIRTHGQKYFTKLAKGEVFPLEPYRSMYDKPSSPTSASTAVPPLPPFVQGGGEVMRHQLNGSASHTSPWMENVSFGMSQRSGGGGRGVGGGGDFSGVQMMRCRYPHPQLLQPGEQQQQQQQQQEQQTMPSVAGRVESPAFDGLSSTMLHMTSASAGGALTQGQSPGSSSSFSSSPTPPSPAANGGATSSMDHSHRFGESMNGRPVDPAMSAFTSTSLPPLCPSPGGNDSSLSTPGSPGAGFAGGAALGWPGGGVPGGAPEGTNESAVGGQYIVQIQQQRRQQLQQRQQRQQQQLQQLQQKQERMQTCPEGWEHQQGHQPPLLPEGLGPLEGWLNSPLLQEEEAGTEDPDGDLALDFVRDFDSLGAL